MECTFFSEARSRPRDAIPGFTYPGVLALKPDSRGFAELTQLALLIEQRAKVAFSKIIVELW